MRLLLSAAALLSVAAIAPAQDVAVSDPPPVHDLVPDPPPIVQRVSALERENVLLKARVAALEGKAAPVKAAVGTFPQKCDCPPRVSACLSDNCPADGKPGPCSCGAKMAAAPRVLTRAEFDALYPAYAAPGVTASAPFVQSPCGSGGCPTTPGTTVRYADGVNTFRPDPVQSGGLIYTVAPPATSGITSGGCANGACVAPSRFAPARGLFRR